MKKDERELKLNEYFECYAPETAICEKEHNARYKYARSFAQGLNLLDIGCGYGKGTYLLSKVAKSAIGIDYHKDLISYLKKKYIRKNLAFYVMDCSDKLKFKDNVFDIICGFDIIEHLNNPEQFLKEVRRVLKPEGKLLLSTPNALHEKGYPYHTKEYNELEFRSLLQHYFDQVALLGQGFNVLERTGNDTKRERGLLFLRIKSIFLLLPVSTRKLLKKIFKIYIYKYSPFWQKATAKNILIQNGDLKNAKHFIAICRSKKCAE
ncbi:MAG: class I SAM-dependent methyltransferase [bacterium]